MNDCIHLCGSCIREPWLPDDLLHCPAPHQYSSIQAHQYRECRLLKEMLEAEKLSRLQQETSRGQIRLPMHSLEANRKHG